MGEIGPITEQSVLSKEITSTQVNIFFFLTPTIMLRSVRTVKFSQR